MSTSFPTGIDSYSPHATNDVIAASHVNDLQDAVTALETKVGQNTSAVTTSLDYIVNHLSGGGSGPDIAASLGVTTMPRAAVTNVAGQGTGLLYLTGFVPQVSFTASKIRTYVPGAGNTTTSCWLGIYSIVPSTGAGTLIAITANDITISVAGLHTTNLVTPVALVAGNAYMYANLGVGGTYTPASGPSTNLGIAGWSNPRIAAFLSGQSTMPASFTLGSLTVTSTPVYAEILV